MSRLVLSVNFTYGADDLGPLCKCVKVRLTLATNASCKKERSTPSTVESRHPWRRWFGSFSFTGAAWRPRARASRKRFQTRVHRQTMSDDVDWTLRAMLSPERPRIILSASGQRASWPSNLPSWPSALQSSNFRAVAPERMRDANLPVGSPRSRGPPGTGTTKLLSHATAGRHCATTRTEPRQKHWQQTKNEENNMESRRSFIWSAVYVKSVAGPT